MTKLALLGVFPLLLGGASLTSPQEIMHRVAEAEQLQRAAALPYTALRNYAAENKRFGVKASMSVEVKSDARGQRTFRILSATGPSAVRKLVFQRLLDTETKSSATLNQARNRVSLDNYEFRSLSTAVLNGVEHYVLEAEPKSSNPLLFRGKVFIEARTFAIVRIEGTPAQKPSFWVDKTRFVHENALVDGQTLPVSNKSQSQIKIFGTSVVEIRYSDYKFAVAPSAP